VEVPNELSQWHIECKGTKSPLIERSKLASVTGWVQQVNGDCPEDKEWVIKNWANNHSPIALIPPCTFKKIAHGNISPIAIVGDSYSPVIELEKAYQALRIMKSFNHRMGYEFTPTTPVVVYEYDKDDTVNVGGIILAVAANTWLKWALAYEKSILRIAS
jgi:hypothetical protein